MLVVLWFVCGDGQALDCTSQKINMLSYTLQHRQIHVLGSLYIGTAPITVLALSGPAGACAQINTQDTNTHMTRHTTMSETATTNTDNATHPTTAACSTTHATTAHSTTTYTHWEGVLAGGCKDGTLMVCVSVSIACIVCAVCVVCVVCLLSCVVLSYMLLVLFVWLSTCITPLNTGCCVS